MGFAVRSIARASPPFLGLGFSEMPGLPDAVEPDLHIRLRFLRSPCSKVVVELVEGLDRASPVERLLQKSGPSPYHLCFRVDDLASAAAHLKTLGYRALTGPIAASSFRVQFFHHAETGLIELAQL
ncbi:MAG TPA: VOC family protein [Vicinamibacteria bacterium]